MCDDCSETTSTSDTSSDISSDTSTDTSTDTTSELPEDTGDLSNDGSEELPDDSDGDFDCEESEPDDCSEGLDAESESAEPTDVEEENLDIEESDNQDGMDEFADDIEKNTLDDTTDDDFSKSEIEKQESNDLYADGSEELPDGEDFNAGISNNSDDVSVNLSNENDTVADFNEMSNKSHHNDTPYEDSQRAFEYVDSHYSKDSPTWQECANRQMELNQNKIDSMKPKYDDLIGQRNDLDHQLQDYIRNNEMTPEKCVSDSQYQDLLAKRQNINNQCNELGNQINQYQNQNDAVSGYINPDMKTTFKGFNGSDFNQAYNGYITQQQGHAQTDVQGCCGIDSSVSKINQQNGTLLNESDGVKECVNNNWCEYNSDGDPNDNGGTNYSDRTKFLNEHGLTNERIEGAYKGNGDPISLKDVANRFNSGESCGLMLKAQDLSQDSLSTRKNSVGDWWNGIDQKSANHATTIAGFSYDTNGDVAGVWLNDTGGWAGSNRVYVSCDKFNQMQQNTKGFAVEYSKRSVK